MKAQQWSKMWQDWYVRRQTYWRRWLVELAVWTAVVWEQHVGRHSIAQSSYCVTCAQAVTIENDRLPCHKQRWAEIAKDEGLVDSTCPEGQEAATAGWLLHTFSLPLFLPITHCIRRCCCCFVSPRRPLHLTFITSPLLPWSRAQPPSSVVVLLPHRTLRRIAAQHATQLGRLTASCSGGLFLLISSTSMTCS